MARELQDSNDEGDLEDLVREMEHDHTILPSLILTLELNKFEARHQKPESPSVITRKEYNRFGLITGWDINPRYEHLREEWESIMGDADIRRKGLKLNYLLEKEKETLNKLRVMLVVYQVEKMLYENAPQEKKDEKSPPFFNKTYDTNGFPITYSINPNAGISTLLIQRG